MPEVIFWIATWEIGKPETLETRAANWTWVSLRAFIALVRRSANVGDKFVFMHEIYNHCYWKVKFSGYRRLTDLKPKLYLCYENGTGGGPNDG